MQPPSPRARGMYSAEHGRLPGTALYTVGCLVRRCTRQAARYGAVHGRLPRTALYMAGCLVRRCCLVCY